MTEQTIRLGEPETMFLVTFHIPFALIVDHNELVKRTLLNTCFITLYYAWSNLTKDRIGFFIYSNPLVT